MRGQCPQHCGGTDVPHRGQRLTHAKFGETKRGDLYRLFRLICSYGQRNGKPLAPMTMVPDVQAMPLPVMYQPLLGLAAGSA
jgi:hypothetical protein